MGDDGAISRTGFEGRINFIDGGLGDFESVGNVALRIALEDHVGDGESFAKHDLLDGREEIVEEVGGFGG